MTDIRYYPLIDRDLEGTEKMAMIPTLKGSIVKAQSGMWLEEMIPNLFRLCTNKRSSAGTVNIHCPRCGMVLKRISAGINETKHGLYVCSACTKK